MHPPEYRDIAQLSVGAIDAKLMRKRLSGVACLQIHIPRSLQIIGMDGFANGIQRAIKAAQSENLIDLGGKRHAIGAQALNPDTHFCRRERNLQAITLLFDFGFDPLPFRDVKVRNHCATCLDIKGRHRQGKPALLGW